MEARADMEKLALQVFISPWGMDLSKVVVFVGESGDTDYEGLLGGVHKSVVLTGVCSSASSQLHANRSYPLSDVIYSDGPNIARASEECSSSDLRVLLEEQGLLKS
ncbi:putative sucrose-phosphate synthase 1 [Sesamum angolense]|uniref:Sucrose-phosphate synthase 1 n=1 Tax=Sesamum angolense TaxID=2727404 RepID=A0AAE1WE36_9LAMI|nr:putative sucrose-phosphate synthase 1 [Sesamum angolense]